MQALSWIQSFYLKEANTYWDWNVRTVKWGRFLFYIHLPCFSYVSYLYLYASKNTCKYPMSFVLVTKRKWGFFIRCFAIQKTSDFLWDFIMKNMLGNGLNSTLLCWLFLIGKIYLFRTCFFPLFLCSLLNENEVNLRAWQSFRLKKFFILNLLL